MNDIEQKIVKIVAETLKIDSSKVTLDSNIPDDLGADSLDQVELMMAIEAAFDCDIPDEDAGKISTIADVVKYVTEKTSSKV